MRREKQSNAFKARGKARLGGLLAGLALVAIVVGIAGCGGSDDDSSSDGRTSITLMSDFHIPWVPDVPWIYALEEGWYEKAGLDVDYIYPQGTSSPARLVGVGKVDMAITYTSDLMNGVQKDLDAKALMSVFEKLPGGVCALEGSGIDEPKDLEGKTVAIVNTAHSLAHWKHFFEANGVDESKVNIVDAGADPTPLLIAGKVDAADAASPAECLQAALATGKKQTEFPFTEEWGFPKTYFLEIAAYTPWLEQNKAAARKFVQTTQKAISYCEQNQEECLEVYMASAPDEIDPEVATEGYKVMKNFWCGETASCWDPDKPIGWINPDVWVGEAEFLKDLGLLEGEPEETLEATTDNEYLSDKYLPQP